MIKIDTLGMLDVAKVNPVLKHTEDVKNYSFITVDDELYLVSNTITGDNAYREDIAIPAGEYLNGFLVRAWDGQKLVIDSKHIDYVEGKKYSDITIGDDSTNATIMKAKANGKLEVITTAPTSGVYFKVTDKCMLTENAIKAKVIVVDKDTKPSA